VLDSTVVFCLITNTMCWFPKLFFK